MRTRRVKTDKRDARALADACVSGTYRMAHRTSEARRQLKAQLSVRDALVRERAKHIVLMGLSREIEVKEGDATGPLPLGGGAGAHRHQPALSGQAHRWPLAEGNEVVLLQARGAPRSERTQGGPMPRLSE
ncbi:MAG: hypothetical protein ACT4TC_10595 [Myxococcaceae bacterium]